RGRRAEGDRTGIAATVFPIAGAATAASFDGNFKGRKWRVLAEILRSHLIDRHTAPGILGLARGDAAEPCTRAERMHRRSDRRLVLQTAHDGQLLLEFFKRFENRGKLEVGALRRRSPTVHNRAVWEVDESH